MNRRRFFRSLAVGAAGVITIPGLLAEESAKATPAVRKFPNRGYMVDMRRYPPGLLYQIQQNNTKYYTSAYSLADFNELMGRIIKGSVYES